MSGKEKRMGASRGFIEAVTDFVFAQAEPIPADIVFIPGSVCVELAEKAAALYHGGYATWVLPSGRYSITRGALAPIPEAVRRRYPGEAETECALLCRVLRANGVPEAAILREDRATYTWENARLSRQVTEAAGLKVRRALLCCRPSHARRALLYYQAAYPEAELVPIPVSLPGENREDWWQTPAGRSRVLGELTRLGGQIQDVFEEMITHDGYSEESPRGTSKADAGALPEEGSGGLCRP